MKLYNDITNQEISSGYMFVGYISLNGQKQSLLEDKLHCLGSLNDLQNIIEQENIEEIIIVLDSKDENEIYNIIFSIQNPNIEVFMPSDRKDLLTGSIKLSAIFSVPLVRISQNLMEPWEFSLKRAFDIFVAIISILLLTPAYIIVAIIVKTTSKGPILYAQERIGKNGKPFKMYKFRSMYTDAGRMDLCYPMEMMIRV